VQPISRRGSSGASRTPAPRTSAVAGSAARWWVLALLCGLVLVALAVGLDKYGVPDPPSSERQPWLPWLFGSLLVAWAGLGAALVLATRSRPAVSHAEREVLARLRASEHRELRVDLRSPRSPEADHLDVVAAAWLAERGAVLLSGLQILFAFLFATVWQLNPLTLLPLLAALVLGQQLVEDVRDLLAARAWLAARRGPGRRA
jgi:hypothetical protein